MAEATSNPMAVAALVIAAASAAFTGGSYLAADAGVRQQREALLVAQRVEACAVLTRHAGDADAAGWGAQNWLGVERERTEHFAEARAAMLGHIVDFTDASVLTFLGPTELERAQNDLAQALNDAFVELNREEAGLQEITTKLQASLQARIAFRQACVSAVGRFRD